MPAEDEDTTGISQQRETTAKGEITENT